MGWAPVTCLALCAALFLASCGGSSSIGTGDISTMAGNGTAGYNGDNQAAISAELNSPSGVALDGAGNLYIADTLNHAIRKVDTQGNISTVAGSERPGYSGDGGSATAARLNNPTRVAVDAAGNLYITDLGNNVVRKVTAASTIITTVAGNGTAGYAGDGGSATAAELSDPTGIAVTSGGDLYISEPGNSVVRKVTASTGIITTIAGNGTPGYSGDGGSAASAELNNPSGLAVDSTGNLYIADSGNARVRQVAASSGTITTVAGDGVPSYSGDRGAATSAELNDPMGVALDASGNLYIAEAGNARVRIVTASNGIINTLAGNGTTGFSGDGGAANGAELNSPVSAVPDTAGNVYIADRGNQRIRKAAPAP
jgi:sugar lactone lactonase YvrE